MAKEIKYEIIEHVASLGELDNKGWSKEINIMTWGNNKKPVIDSLTKIASDYRFVRPVRTKALELLKANSGTSSSDSKKSNSDSESKK